MKRSPARAQGPCRPSSPRSRRAATRSPATLPNLPDPAAPAGGEDDAVTLREVGERPSFDFEVRDHLDLGLEHGWIEIEKAAAASGSRFAYLLGDLVMVELALISFAVDTGPRAGLRAGRPAGAGPGGAALRHRLLPGRAGDDLRGRARRALPRRDLGGARWPPCTPTRSSTARDCRSATRGSRPASAARRAPRARTRADLPRASVRQGRDVLVRRPDESAAEHERLLAVQESILGARAPLPRRGHRGRRPRRPRGAEVRLRGVDPEPGALPRAHLLLEHDRLPGAPPGRPVSPGAEAPPQVLHTLERHGGRRRPDPDRAARERSARGRQRGASPRRWSGRARRPRFRPARPRARSR